MADAQRKESVSDRKEALQIIQEISSILDTGLDAEELEICVGLIEQGVNPEALALVIKDLKREAKRLKEEK